MPASVVAASWLSVAAAAEPGVYFGHLPVVLVEQLAGSAPRLVGPGLGPDAVAGWLGLARLGSPFEIVVVFAEDCLVVPEDSAEWVAPGCSAEN